MRYEDSMRGIADCIIREQQHEAKQKEKEHIYWYDEYATLNFFIHICRCIGNVKGSELSGMVARLKELNPQAVENHEYREAWVFDYDTMFQVLTENQICRKVCEKSRYRSWEELISRYCVPDDYWLKAM